MTGFQKIRSILLALLMLILAAFLFLDPTDGPVMMNLIVTIVLFVLGVRTIAYYIFIAHHMVDGQMILYQGIILLDISILANSLNEMPHVFMLLYPVASFLVSAVLAFLEVNEARKLKDPKWLLRSLYCIVCVALAIACVILRRQTTILTYAFGLELVGSAAVRLVRAFRKTAVAYIPEV